MGLRQPHHLQFHARRDQYRRYPEVLFQTLNAKFSQATWQLQFQKAAAVWQAVANINLSQVSDNGSPESTNGNQQDDPRFGDIRIGMVNLGSGVLAETFLPPPANGGTAAGDMFLNSSASWQINTSYDLETVAIHEFGHALGLGQSQITTACMYAYYNGVKQSLTSDDIAGIQSVWGAPQSDQFNSNGQSNGNYTTAANITSYIGSNGQIAIPSLRITSGVQVEWFSVTVPASTNGTMTVTEQSTSLSLLSPMVVLLQARLRLSHADRRREHFELRGNGELFTLGCAGRTNLSRPSGRHRGRRPDRRVWSGTEFRFGDTAPDCSTQYRRSPATRPGRWYGRLVGPARVWSHHCDRKRVRVGHRGHDERLRAALKHPASRPFCDGEHKPGELELRNHIA